MPAIGTNNNYRAVLPPPPKPVTPAPRQVGHMGGMPAVSHPTAPAAQPGYVSPTGGSDAATSGPGYGSAQATHYKATPQYRQAVKDVFLAQPAQAQGQIIRNLLTTHKSVWTPELSAIHDAWMHMPTDQAMALQHYLPHTRGDIGKLLGGALGAASSVLRPPNMKGTALAGFLPQNLALLPIRAGLDVGKATVESPSVIPKTVKGLGETALGSAAAIADLGIKEGRALLPPGLGGKGNVITPVVQLAKGMVKDYSQRYGPLIHGNDQAFIDRIKKQGAGAELLDALGAVGGIDATLGRAVSNMAKVREGITGEANFLTRQRPALRLSGGETRAQQLGHGAAKITAQRIADRLRQARGSKIPLHEGEVAPFFPGRSARVLVSSIASKWRHLMQSQLNEHVRSRHGAEGAARRLSKGERKAMPVAIEGYIPLRSGHQAALEWVDKRMQQIKEDRAKGGPRNPGNRIPQQTAEHVDELRTLQWMRDHPDQWVTPKLADYVDHQGVRAGTIEDKVPRSYAQKVTMEARRLRAQGEMLGIEHPDAMAERMWGAGARSWEKRTEQGGTALAAQDAKAMREYEANRASYLAKYVDKVRAKRPADWHEPAFIKHSSEVHNDFASYTQGGGSGAMPSPELSKFINWRAGVVDRRPQAYFDSLARTIKAQHHWHFVDEQFRRNRLPTPTRQQIKDALGMEKAPGDLTGRELRQVLVHQGVDMRHVRFYSPGRLATHTIEANDLVRGGSRAGSEPARLDTNAELHNLLDQNHISVDGEFAHQNQDFMRSPGFKAIPKNAFDEIHSNLKPSGRAGRITGKIQGAAAGAILGMSPSFVVMNTLAHIYLAAFGTRGRLLSDAVKFPLWWHSLSKEDRALVRAHAGGRVDNRLPRMGATAQSDIVNGWRELKQSGLGRVMHDVNPFHALFKAEDLQSNFFRHMVYYSATKRMALEEITRNMRPAAEAMARVSEALSVKAKPNVADRMTNLIRAQSSAEELGRYTVDMMGDYARFTHFERTALNNRAVLFYSFLRHATRTLLYVLPFKHPIATALVGEMAKLHNDEVKKLLGGQDLPFAYSRVFFDNKGKLTSIDFMRASPVGGAVADVASGGLSALSKLIAPEVGPLLDAMYGQTVSGQKTGSPFFSILNDYLSMSYPYRLGRELHFGTRIQQADSVPYIHERPESRKTASARQYQAAKEQALGPVGQAIAAGALGLVPKPDDSRVIARRRAQQAAAKARGRGRPSGGLPSLGAPGLSTPGGGAPGLNVPGL